MKEHSNYTTSLSHLCSRHGLTVKQLCEITDTPRRTLENWCHAHPVRVEALVLGASRAKSQKLSDERIKSRAVSRAG